MNKRMDILNTLNKTIQEKRKQMYCDRTNKFVEIKNDISNLEKAKHAILRVKSKVFNRG